MMNDELITRTAVMESLTKEYNRRGTGDGLKLAWIEKAVSDTPSAQPEPCEDTISRQAVLDIVDDLRDRMTVVGYWSMVERIKALPSAQPEIIRCKDCRYSIDEYGDGECYCKRPSRELVWIGKRWDFFCAAARLKMEVEHE